MCTEILSLLCGAVIGGATAAAVQESAPERTVEEVRALFERHDRLVEGHDLDAVTDLYCPDFCSPQYDVWDRQGMLHKWKVLLEEHFDFRLKTNVHGVEQVGDWYAVACCRPFQARSFEDRSVVVDDFCGSFLLQRGADGKLRQVCILPIDLEAQARLEADGRYVARDLGYALGPMPSCFTLALPPDMAELDRLRFFDPVHDRVVDLVVMTSMLEITVERALQQDARSDSERSGATDVSWIAEPAPLELDSYFRAYAASYRLETETGDVAVNRIYASEDDDTIFAFTARGPLDGVEQRTQLLSQLVSSLHRVDAEGEENGAEAVPVAEWVCSHGPSTFEDGVWKVPGTTLQLKVDESLTARPLPGAMVARLRLVPKDDPRTTLLLMVFPNGSCPPSPEEMLEDAIRSVTDLLCGPTESTWIDRTEHVPMLGALAVSRTLTMRCSVSGKMTVHRLIDLPFDDCHVFLQLVPGSADEAAQDRAFAAVVAGLCKQP